MDTKMDGEAFFFTGRGKAKNLQGGEGVQICGVGNILLLLAKYTQS